MMLTMVLIADDEDDAEDNDNTVVNDNVQSAGSQGSSSTVPGLKAHPGAQGLLHWRQGEHHPLHVDISIVVIVTNYKNYSELC